jgi:glycerol-3-phosphate acyltransferase PlsY
MGQILVIALSYFLGAVPFGYIIAKKYYGIDIRQHGSGNPGATNVWRTLGKKPGMITLALDILKGFIPVLIARLMYPSYLGLHVLCGLLAIVGHNWTIFLKGKGGKGVATSAGVFLALLPKQCAVAIVTFAVLLLTTGHVSVGAMAAAVALFLATLIMRTYLLHKVIVLIAAVMVLVKHVPNMKRLARGEEPKVKFR